MENPYAQGQAQELDRRASVDEYVQEFNRFKVAQDFKKQQEERDRFIARTIQPVENKFSGPVKLPEPEVIAALRKQETEDRMARDRMGQVAEPEASIETPPSLYHELHGETMLSKVLGLPRDNAQTEFLNNYVIQKMRIGKLQDTQANYEKVFNRLLASNNLGRNQQKSYITSKLYLALYLSNHDINEEDNLILSILNNKRGLKRGVRR